MRGTYRVGFAKADITPRAGVAMAGYAARESGAMGCHDELYAHVMVLEDSSRAIAVINLDLLEVTSELAWELRKRISEVSRIPKDHVLISATHTHSGPLVSEWFGEVQDPETMNRIMTGSVKAVQEAQGNLQSVQVRRGEGIIQGIAKDRRSLQETPDPNLQVLGFYVGTSLIGCVVNFALHPTVLGADNLLYSADYPGYIRNFIARHHPRCNTLVLNGAAGNINIGYSADASALGEVMDFRTFAKAEEVGKAIAGEALSILQQSLSVERIKVCVGSSKIKLPLKALPILDELEDEILRLQGIQRVYMECVRDAIKKLDIEGRQELLIELQALSIGDVVLMGIPGEPFAEIGLAIKGGWPKNQVMVVGYANGSLGYLPTFDAHQEGRYEAETTVFHPTMADILIRDVRCLIGNILA